MLDKIKLWLYKYFPRYSYMDILEEAKLLNKKVMFCEHVKRMGVVNKITEELSALEENTWDKERIDNIYKLLDSLSRGTYLLEE